MRKPVPIWQALALVLVGAVPAWYGAAALTGSLRSSQYDLIIEKDAFDTNACFDNLTAALPTCKPMQCKFFNSSLETNVISGMKTPTIRQFVSLHDNAQEYFSLASTQDNKCNLAMENMPVVTKSVSSESVSINVQADSIQIPTTSVRCNLTTDQVKSISETFKTVSPVMDKSNDNKNGKTIDGFLKTLMQKNTCKVAGTP